MKKALRILLPLLLTIVILASAVWYLLIYDPDFTRDTILDTAREFDKGGHHKVAAWLYDLAYQQSRGGDEVAIELAEHYKSIGNYTKAEYTLSGAISDGGTAELYVALCQTYVEQDKLLDAVNMLANIKDPAIKAQIDAMRPAAPTFDLDAGFYSQYITVTVQSQEADLYINAQGQYPSTTGSDERKQAVTDYVTTYFSDYLASGTFTQPEITDFSTQSVTLPQGETTIYAVAIGSNNLVSELSIRGYTVGGIIEEVTLTDAKLDEYVRQMLNFSAGRTIYTNDLWTITQLDVPEEVVSYADLQHFTYLQKLTIPKCASDDLTAIASLSQLKELSVSGGELSQDSLKTIGSLRGLEKLTLSGCGLSTVAPLEGLTGLTYLDLSGNTLRNISVFAGMTKLQELRMASNALTDLAALSGLKELKVLDVSHNSLQSLSPLYSLTGLLDLNADSNALMAVEGISALSSIQTLNLAQNGLTDLSPLSGCTTLTELDISNNKIEDITVLASLTQLIRVNFSHNAVTQFPQFPEEHALASINASYNLLTDIEPLSTLKALYTLDIDYNEEVESLDALLKCRNLIQVNCYGTKIVRSPFSEDQGVVVNLNPSVYYDTTG